MFYLVVTFPTAASPRRTSFTLLLGLGAFESAIVPVDNSGKCLLNIDRIQLNNEQDN